MNRLVCPFLVATATGFLLACTLPASPASGADCPQWGGSPARNNVSPARGLPTAWDVGEIDQNTNQWTGKGAKNIRWVARLGAQTYGTPVVAGGCVFCATNNAAGHVKRYPAGVDLGCLLCFQQSDGRFGWQLSCEKLAAGRAVDWPHVGICAAPLVEGRRAWIVTNRSEVLCLDVDGNYGRRDEGSGAPGPAGRDEARVLWRFDMIGQLRVTPHNMSSCSVTAAGDLLLVTTANGVDEAHKKVASPEAPSFIALNKTTGKLVWADNSPGENILHGQWSSPAYAVIGGVPQAIFAGGDGWVYSFAAKAGNCPDFRLGENGTVLLSKTGTGSGPMPLARPELLWKFDCNPKTSAWQEGGRGERNSLIATPVVVGDRVYIATGDDPEFGEGPGHLWCIDATKRGDVSPELVFDRQGKPVGPRRVQAADPKAGDELRPNPNSAAVWHYAGREPKGGKGQFEDIMHRTLGMAVVQDDLVVIADLSGILHCLDAKTGRPHWTHDMMAAVWGSPLVADGKIFLGTEDGEVAVFELSATKKLLAKNPVGSAVYTTPVAAGNTIYIATRSHLVAVSRE